MCRGPYSPLFLVIDLLEDKPIDPDAILRCICVTQDLAPLHWVRHHRPKSAQGFVVHVYILNSTVTVVRIVTFPSKGNGFDEKFNKLKDTPSYVPLTRWGVCKIYNAHTFATVSLNHAVLQ